MSNTFSDLAASALIEALNTQPEGGRHLVSSVHGESLADLFRSVLSKANEERLFPGGEGAVVPMKVLTDGAGSVIVPYLVLERLSPESRNNRGSQGFVSALRDVYSDCVEAGERVFLLAFDDSPNETLLTTMSQEATEQALNLRSLFSLALQPPDESTQALKRLLPALFAIVPVELKNELTPTLIGRTRQGIDELACLATTEEVADSLFLLPFCLRDPRLFAHAGPDLDRRIREGLKRRRELEKWAADPTIDFDSEVRATYAPRTVELVLNARVGTDVSWSRFTLDDLLGGSPTPPEPEVTPAFAAMPALVHGALASKILANGKTVAVKTAGPGCGITFNLTTKLVGDATIHLIGCTGTEPPFSSISLGTVTSDQSAYTIELSELPQARPGWSFLQASLTKGKRLVKTPIDTIFLAIEVGSEDDPFLYEINGIIDLEAQAFSAEETFTVVAEEPGSEPWTSNVQPDDIEDAEYGCLLEARKGVSIPGVLAFQQEQATANEPCESPEHLAVEQWKLGVLPPGDLKISLRRLPGDLVVADIGPAWRQVVESQSMPVSRWEIERHVIENPRTTAFVIDGGLEIKPNDDIENLALGELGELHEKFLEARVKFFAELGMLAVPSILGADLANSEMASNYVRTYRDLVESVPDDKASHLGYDKLLLADSVKTEHSELFFAPTSPLAVALHIQFQKSVRVWVNEPPADNYFEGDVDAVTVQYLVPYLRLHTYPGQWLESAYAPYAWRRYLPAGQLSRSERPPMLHRYIARRIERFLDVHPSYADERRTLRLAFINPGTGAHIKDALLSLMTTRTTGRGADLRKAPAFDIQLLSDEQNGVGVLGAELDLFMGHTPEDGQPTDVAVEVMKRLSYHKGSTSEFLSDPKSFAHLVFVEDYFKPQFDLVEVPRSSHPSSMYVGGLAADIERLTRIEPAATRFLSATWGDSSSDESAAGVANRTTEVSAAATGVPVQRGIVRAADVVVPFALIPEIYGRAAWVVHIDRHVGLELFSPQSSSAAAPYVLDYTDQETPDAGIYDGITATSQVGPYRARVAEVLGQLNQVVDEDAADRLLRTLNLISGRWGLEMLRTPDNSLRGRLATALAVQVIEQSEKLHSDTSVLNLVIALDELLRVSGGEGLSLKPGWAAKGKLDGGNASDDLLILTIPLNSTRATIHGRIVEVKYRSGAGGGASADDAAKQLKNTHNLLTRVFISDAQPGRVFQGRRLAKLILRYLGRHVAYGLESEHPALSNGSRILTQIASGEYEFNLETIRDGKSLIGDYLSVEPDRSDSALDIQASDFGEFAIGRIRIGQPIIESMLKHGRLSEAIFESHREHGELSTGRGSSEPSVDGSTAEELSETTSPQPRTRAGTVESPAEEHRHFQVNDAELRELAGRLDDVLTSYNLPLQPVQAADAVCGPNVIRFRVRMARGGTIAQLESRERDIERELGLAKQVMVGQDAGFVTFDIPRPDPVSVKFVDLITGFKNRPRSRGQLPVLFGVDVAGAAQVEDLAQLPHLLVAGSTGTGKSVFLSSLIGSLATLPPSELEIVLVDIKGLDFAPFGQLPHLRRAPIGDPAEALDVLESIYIEEKTRRQKILSEAGAQSIIDYYTRCNGSDLPQVVIVIDEFSNLLGTDKTTGSRLEDIVQQYAEIMRSFGIYLVIATQRPSADIVTGRIKANLPARCAFRLPMPSDSVTILGRKGAEQLLGKGDMLFYREGVVDRLQAPLTFAQDVLRSAYE